MSNLPERISVGGTFLDRERLLESLSVEDAFLELLPTIAPECLEDLYRLLPMTTRLLETVKDDRDPGEAAWADFEEQIAGWSRRWGQGLDWFAKAGAYTLWLVADAQLVDPSQLVSPKFIVGVNSSAFRQRDPTRIRDLIVSLSSEEDRLAGVIHIDQIGVWLPWFEKREAAFDRMVADYKKKLKERFDEAEATFSQELPPATRFTTQHIEWTIRHITNRETLSSIVRKACRDPQTVREGIDTICAVLDFKRPGAQKQPERRSNKRPRTNQPPNEVKLPQGD